MRSDASLEKVDLINIPGKKKIRGKICLKAVGADGL
jgi:hypothetical protein